VCIVLSKFAVELCKRFSPYLNNVSTLYLLKVIVRILSVKNNYWNCELKKKHTEMFLSHQEITSSHLRSISSV